MTYNHDNKKVEVDTNLLKLSYRSHLLKRIRELLSRYEGEDQIIKQINSLLNQDRMGTVGGPDSYTSLLYNSKVILTIHAKYPELNTGDLELCFWLYHGLDSKLISELMARSPSTVKGRRSRLRRKLGLKEKGESLHAFLQKFLSEE